MTRIPIFQVDAFTFRPFSGNRAAPGPAEEGWMQNVAAEMNLSETAFLLWEGEGWRLRWFTPTVEVDLCGHATLASAHVLWEEGITSDETSQFFTRSGTLTALRNKGWIELDFPAEPETPVEPPDLLRRALGVAPEYTGKNRFDYLVLLSSEQAVRELKPDFALLAQLPARGVIVTAPSDSPEFDFVSRFFGPAAGIPEDPVTGSAHCCLAPFWSPRFHKNEMIAYQASSRGGVVGVRLTGDRVILRGQAVMVLRGELV
ncbi:MAG: PhzF family phenazine biosynthesis protein [Nitrospirae bacterium]|nr:PhzF family phenazine biosynthesis protein [Nitrospirota bacterium]